MWPPERVKGGALRPPREREDAGFSLMEVLVATVIATIAVVGLAYTFGLGRGFINQFEVGRAAEAAAEGEMDLIASTPPSDSLVKIGPLHMSYFMVGGNINGTQRWIINWIDDPADGVGVADPNPEDIRQATVTVLFQHGSLLDSVTTTRLLPIQ